MRALERAVWGSSMVALFVQTLLLMAAAYFIGAALACLIRRSLFTPALAPLPAARTVEPLPEVMQRAPGGFARTPAPEPAPKPVAPAPKPAPGPAAAAVAAAKAERAPAQDLKRIRLIDAGIEAALNKLGVDRYEHIAAWMQPEVKRIGEALGLGGRISQENWIEQAQVLAKGGETYFATRRARGEAASATPTPDEGERRPIPGPAISPRPSTGGAAGVVADVAIAAVAASTPRPAPAPAAPYVAAGCLRARGLRNPACGCGRPCRRVAEDSAHCPAAAGAGGADPAGRTRDPRQPAAHQQHRRRGRERPRCPGRHPLLADRPLVAGRRRALREAARNRGPHRPRELDRAGPDPEPRRRYQVLAPVRPGHAHTLAAGRRSCSRAPPGQARRRHPGALRQGNRDEASDAGRAAARSDIGSLRSVRAEVYRSAEPVTRPSAERRTARYCAPRRARTSSASAASAC